MLDVYWAHRLCQNTTDHADQDISTQV